MMRTPLDSGMGGQPAGNATARRRELRAALRDAGVYLVTEESLSGGRRSEQIVEAALAGGIRAVQVREKDGSTRRALEIALAARRLTRKYGALLIVDDRIDLALACEADGVHVGQDDLPLSTARSLLGGSALVGLSITAAGQLTSPDAAAADCLGIGAVFRTDSKADATITGLALLEAAARTAAAAASAEPDLGRAAIVAIGGITAANASLAVSAGADTVAVITAITAAGDPGRAAADLLAAIRSARVES
jgi:thiamine-phosphate pyrophosphorylase